jgi:hyaluronan synthase
MADKITLVTTSEGPSPSKPFHPRDTIEMTASKSALASTKGCNLDPEIVFDTPVRKSFNIEPLKATINAVLASGLVGALAASYAAGLRLFDLGLTSVALYGTILLGEYLIQLCCAFANRFDVNRIAGRAALKVLDPESTKNVNEGRAEPTSLMNPDGHVSVAVIGYREDEKVWRDCLRSLREQNVRPKCIVGVVDGNDEPDLDMANVFVSEFKPVQAPLIHLPILLSDLHRDTYFKGVPEDVRGFLVKTWHWLTGQRRHGHIAALNAAKEAVMEQVAQWNEQWSISSLNAVCFSQPHGHKHAAMFTAFAISLYALQTRDAVFTTDSHTLVQGNALDEMLTLLHSSPDIGGVTAEVRIRNRGDFLLAQLCSTRYWFTFNIQRACQSLWNCVSCLSGSMSMYRACDLDTILGAWNLQTFGGDTSPFDDDGHLANQLLAHGLKTRYTHRTWCETDFPTTFLEWIAQQTHWSRSFFRNTFRLSSSFAHHSPWILVETIIQAVYPLLLIAIFVHFFFGTSDESHWHILIWVLTLFVIAFVKAVVAALQAADLWLLLFSLYGFVYFFGLLPTQIWAFLTMNHAGWENSAESDAEGKIGQSILQRSFLIGHLAMWYILVIAGLGYFIYEISGSHLSFLVGGVAIVLCILLYWQGGPRLDSIREKLGGFFKKGHKSTKDWGVVEVHEDVLPLTAGRAWNSGSKASLASTVAKSDFTCDSVSLGSALTLPAHGDEDFAHILRPIPKAYILQ